MAQTVPLQISEAVALRAPMMASSNLDFLCAFNCMCVLERVCKWL
jgi:hypothetical protein